MFCETPNDFSSRRHSGDATDLLSVAPLGAHCRRVEDSFSRDINNLFLQLVDVDVPYKAGGGPSLQSYHKDPNCFGLSLKSER